MVDDIAAQTGDVRGSRKLVIANVLDAISRNTLDMVIDAIAVVVVGATALQIGGLNAAGTIAFVILGVPIGVIIDRTDALTAMIFSAISRTFVVALLAVSLRAGHVSFLLLAAVSLLVGMSGAVSEAGQAVRAVQVATSDGVGPLVARMSGADNVVSLLAPAAVGLLLGIVAPYWLVAGSAVVSLLSTLMLFGRGDQRWRLVSGAFGGVVVVNSSSSRSTSRVNKGRAYFQEVRVGFRAFLGQPLLRGLTIAMALLNFALAAYSAVDSILVLRILRLDMAAFGLLITFGAAGGIIGSFLAGKATYKLSRTQIVVVAMSGLTVLSALPLIAIAIPQAGFWLMGVRHFLWGILMVIANVQTMAITAAAVPREVLGRVSAFKRSLTFGVVPVGGLVGGLIATTFGPRTLIAATILITALGAATVWQVRNYRVDA